MPVLPALVNYSKHLHHYMRNISALLMLLSLEFVSQSQCSYGYEMQNGRPIEDACFACFGKLFQTLAPLYEKHFCPFDVAFFGVRKSEPVFLWL